MPPNSARHWSGRIPSRRRWPPSPAPVGSGNGIRTTSTSSCCARACTTRRSNTTLRVKDTADEIDLEPVSHTTLRGLLDTQRTVHDAPTGIDVAKLSRITVVGDADEVRGALRAWIAQAVTWHDPAVLGIALAGPDLEDDAWSWLKWLPHVDVPGEIDGVGPARYLATTQPNCADCWPRAGRA